MEPCRPHRRRSEKIQDGFASDPDSVFQWERRLPAQWEENPKNSRYLAMSIEQSFSESILSEHMVSWKRCEALYPMAKEMKSKEMMRIQGLLSNRNVARAKERIIDIRKTTPTAQWTVSDLCNFLQG